MQYYPAKILIHFKSSKVKIAINNKYIINYKIKYKNNASLVFDDFEFPHIYIIEKKVVSLYIHLYNEASIFNNKNTLK